MIRVSQLTVTHGKAIRALRSLNFEIPVRKVTCVMGPNASGKTTLLKTLAGLTSYSGSVYLNFRELRKYSKRELARLVGYTGAVSSRDFFSIKVREVLVTAFYPFSNSFFDSPEHYKYVEEISRDAGIEHLLDRRLNELSSGELQKVFLALIIARSPQYYLLDEPDSHLDIGFKPELIKMIRKLSQSSTVLIATHDPLFAFKCCDYFIILNKGELVLSGEKKDLIENLQILSRVYGVRFETLLGKGGEKLIIPVYE
ncbi:MAG: ABC transporter ATP-binding protein [Thermosphaera sp.]